jgi:hypothetical protein
LEINGVEVYCCTRSHSVHMHTHSDTRTHTIGRTPLDEGSARRRDLHLTTHNTDKTETSIPPKGFEPAIPASEQPQTHASNRSATEIGKTHPFLRQKRDLLACYNNLTLLILVCFVLYTINILSTYIPCAATFNVREGTQSCWAPAVCRDTNNTA